MSSDLTNENLLIDDKLMTVAEVANYLRLSRHSVYNLIESGVLPSIKIGVMKVKKSWLIEMLETYKNYDLTNIKSIDDIRPLNFLKE